MHERQHLAARVEREDVGLVAGVEPQRLGHAAIAVDEGVAPVLLRHAGLHAVATARLDRLTAADLEALAAADDPSDSAVVTATLDAEGNVSFE